MEQKKEQEILARLRSASSSFEVIDILLNEEQTPLICKEVISMKPSYLKYIKEQTPEICAMALQAHFIPIHEVTPLQYVKEQTPELCMMAIKQAPWAIEYVKEQTRELCIAAVTRNGFTIGGIKEQTDELCRIAVEKNPWAIKYIKNQTPELCLMAVKKNGYTLTDIKNQTYEICEAAVMNNPDALLDVKNLDMRKELEKRIHKPLSIAIEEAKRDKMNQNKKSQDKILKHKEPYK